MLTIARKIFLVLHEGLIYGINVSFGASEIMSSIHFSEANTKFCSSLHCNGGNNCFLMEKESLSLKLIMKMLTFQLNRV